MKSSPAKGDDAHRVTWKGKCGRGLAGQCTIQSTRAARCSYCRGQNYSSGSACVTVLSQKCHFQKGGERRDLGHKLLLQPEVSHSYPDPGEGDRCGWSMPTWASFSSLVMFKNICAISRSNTRTRSQSKRRDLSLSALTCRKDKRQGAR